MSKSQSLQRFLAQAREKEKKYDWLDAAKLHKKALLQFLKQKDFLKAGDVQERIGYGLYRAAMQAESQEEFKERMQRATEEYDKAHGFYEQLGDEQKARMFRCKAFAKYLGYWLTSDPSKKRKLLDDCLQLEKNALTILRNLESKLEYVRTYNELSHVFWHRADLEWNKETLKSIIEMGTEWGEKAVEALTKLTNQYEMARALHALATLYLCDLFGYYFITDPEQQEQHRLRTVEQLRRAIEISERFGDAYIAGLAHAWLGLCLGGQESFECYSRGLECGEETRDHYLQATALDLLAYDTYWKAYATEDPDERRNLAERAMEFYDKAEHHFYIIAYQSPRWGAIAAPGGYAEHYYHLARWEIDPQKRLELLLMSEKAGTEALKAAEDSDIPMIIGAMFHILSKTLEARAILESDFSVKRSLLEKALKYRERDIDITERLTTFDYWDLGVEWGYYADIKAELGSLELDLAKKRRMLEEAASNKERSLGLIEKVMSYFEKMGRLELFSALYGYQDSYGAMLGQLYALTNNPEYLRKSIEILQKAIESSNKLDLISYAAESRWKIAEAQGLLEKHLDAAENFKHASESYMKAAEKIPQLKAFYQDHASYMQAWSEIEKAKHHHTKKHYGQAKEHYKKAADFHNSTERWSYLAPNYLAWTQLEAAEDISRREQPKEAKEFFQQAAELFLEAEKSIGAKLKIIEARDEKEMAGALAKASNKRREYCLGRVILEEAKVLDRQGDHVASSKKYGSAAAIFQEIAKDESEHSRKELEPIVYLCQAWQKMMMAEAKASSTMYGEAAELFKQAKEYTVDQQTSLLALANSSFCKALEAGTEFEITGDKANYSATKNHMEAAEKYYLKAGFKTASEYAKATYILFDAYLYMNKAETETEPTKKALYYQMAEKLLQASASSYTKAKHPEKKEEVQRFLESIKEKRQLAMSLTEVLHAPTIVSTTTSFITPTPTHEKAVGLERFEHATIEAHLTASEEVTLDEELEVRLDLANVAKEPGLLVRVDNLVPPSFKVAEPPSPYSVEDGSINMKGRKLEPLKVETIRLGLQATAPGVVNLNPQIIYVDELGKFRMNKLDPVAITVHPKLAFEFKTQAAQRVFSFLVSSFVEDYMRRRISLEKAGWRSLMEIVKHGKVSKSSVYGAGGRRGRAVSELERRGLVETRVFLGERGRGGKILKMRISYDKETIKRHIDQRIMKIKEK